MIAGFNVMRVAIATAAAAVLMFLLALVYVRSHAPHPDMAEYSRILQAAQTYKADTLAKGLLPPPSVTMHELLALGFLKSNEVAGFEALQVTISLKPDASRPGEPLISVKFPDGREVVALGDGSIQQRLGP